MKILKVEQPVFLPRMWAVKKEGGGGYNLVSVEGKATPLTDDEVTAITADLAAKAPNATVTVTDAP